MSSGSDNIWNPVLGLCCHYQIRQRFEDIPTEELGSVALSCRLAPDLLCDASVLQFTTIPWTSTVPVILSSTIASLCRVKHRCLALLNASRHRLWETTTVSLGTVASTI